MQMHMRGATAPCHTSLQATKVRRRVPTCALTLQMDDSLRLNRMSADFSLSESIHAHMHMCTCTVCQPMTRDRLRTMCARTHPMHSPLVLIQDRAVSASRALARSAHSAHRTQRTRYRAPRPAHLSAASSAQARRTTHDARRLYKSTYVYADVYVAYTRVAAPIEITDPSRHQLKSPTRQNINDAYDFACCLLLAGDRDRRREPTESQKSLIIVHDAPMPVF
jgi:hypothetical protein